jgi:anaphase-promoting complex subunit 6
MLKLNRSDQAKQCFLEALALDVKCYDSFEQLINGEMMSVDEGNRFFPASFSSLIRVQNGISSRVFRIKTRRQKTQSSFG